ncbi:MAG: Fmu (Sun) domain protein [Chitinophagaceae bacterium]|nr:Fmu (Sun) domain protein [Chitinophagaceae bacterium]
MPLPQALLESLLTTTGFNKEAFEQVHHSGEQITSVRMNPSKPIIELTDKTFSQPTFPIPWSDSGCYLSQRPSFTFDPLFHAGCYYVQEASSMFLEQAFRQQADLSQPLKVLDLCASPGGKSTHIQSLISNKSLLVSNEVIRSRANVLKDNIVKWGSSNVMVTNNDPKDFSRLENYFDIVVIDAPCSGSGLFRRDETAIAEWSENNVQLCSQRQQRIIADVWPALKHNGLLIYSTCSYSIEEDEEIMDWIEGQLPATNCELDINGAWGITTTITPKGNTGYRFWPHKVKGEGFFLACFKKKEGEDAAIQRVKNKPDMPTKKEMEMIAPWVETEGLHFVKYEQTVYAWPALLADSFTLLLQQLRVIYSGTLIGELMRDKLVPDHALALSGIISGMIPAVPLTYEQAILYLQRKELHLEAEKRGWQLVTYAGYPLGWVNVLPNRVNNYYPKELRILKDSV